jgi:predicted ATPase
VFGLEAEGLDWVDRPLATVEAQRGNLPRPSTEWFGPGGELKQWLAELGRRRLVTLTGPGGVGKTRAALEIGAQAADDFLDGVWMVDLAPVEDPEAVPAAAAAALGVPSQAGLTTADALTGWLQGRRVLVILDNCEHVLDAAAALVATVAADCQTVTILATSRQPLGVVGEQVVPVASRELPDAVELFYDRARLSDASFERAGPDRETVAAVCARLDGIPLAIELAAARVRSLTPAELLARLDDRFKMLRSGQRGGVERHRTLQATVDWSYQLLSRQERAVFDRLSVFPGDFDLAAAEAVCADGDLEVGDVFDLVDGLVAKSLVIAERSGSATRYRLLETLRQYGQARLGERGESADLRQRHLGHYVSLAERAHQRWASPQQAEGITIFNLEWNNLRAAYAAAIDTFDVENAERLLKAIYWFALGAGRFEEYVEWSQRAIDLSRSLGRPLPWIYGLAAINAELAGDGQRAEQLATEGLASAGPDDPAGLLCLAALAATHVFSGRIDGAAATVGPLTAGLAATTNPLIGFQIAFALVQVARTTDPSAAQGYLDRAGQAAATIGAPMFEATVMQMQGELLLAGTQPDIASAADLNRRALAVARTVDLPMIVFQITARQLQLIDALQDDQADQACREAITAGYENDFGLLLAIAIAATARHLDFRGDSQAAGVIVGYLEAHHAGLIHQWGPVVQHDRAGRTLREIAASSDPDWRAKGAAMSRTEWVDYTLNALPSG